MKTINLPLFLFVLGNFSISAQSLSPELLNVVNRLPSNQRNLVFNEYERFKSRNNANLLERRGNENFLPPSTEIPHENRLSQDSLSKSLRNESQSKLELLSELEEMIKEDLKANDLELEKLNNKEDASTSEKKLIFLDRQKDLEKILLEIHAHQLYVISEGVNKFGLEESSEVFPFGYNAFNGSSKSTNHLGYFDFSSQITVIPSDYKIGPGDFLDIHLYGQTDAQYSVSIGRDGIIQFPGIGPLNVLEQGNSFQSLKGLIKEKVSEQLGDGVRVSVSLSELRQIKVFLAGEFNKPGQRLVVAGSSLFSLLLDSSGVSEIASLRSLTLKRKGSPDQVYDLYDLLLKGDRSEVALEEGDIIFLPTVRNRVWVEGKVLRPAIYEILSDSTLSDAIELSGGFSDRAMLSSITLQRVENTVGSIQFKTLDSTADALFKLKNGDRLKIREVSEFNRLAISVMGEVEHPGFYEWKEGLRISEIFKSISYFKTQADLNYALIRRQSLFGDISFLSFSPKKILNAPNSDADLLLEQRDRLIVLSRTDKTQRERTVRNLIEELRQQGNPGTGIASVRILGMVHFPGEYPHVSGMTVGDLIVAGGGMKDSAYTLSSELSRQTVDSNSSTPTANIFHTILGSLLSDKTLATNIQPLDVLGIKPIPSWSETNTVEILGEVRFPGTYIFQKNETLKSVFERAGGFTKEAFPQGAVFTRLNLVAREEEQKERLITQLEADLANISLAAGSEGTATKAKSVADGLLSRLKNSKSKGRLVIDLSDQVSKNARDSIIVRDGDKLIVPSLPYELSVVGEVQFATSHLFDPKLNIKDYIQRSGGFSVNADVSRVFVVKSNGSVLTKANSGWFKQSENSRLEAGDVIVVPVNLEKGRWLETLTSGTQVIYQLAVAAAAVNSF